MITNNKHKKNLFFPEHLYYLNEKMKYCNSLIPCGFSDFSSSHLLFASLVCASLLWNKCLSSILLYFLFSPTTYEIGESRRWAEYSNYPLWIAFISLLHSVRHIAYLQFLSSSSLLWSHDHDHDLIISNIYWVIRSCQELV